MLLGLTLGMLALWPLTPSAGLAGAVIVLGSGTIGLVGGLIGLQARMPAALRGEGTAIFLTLVTLFGTKGGTSPASSPRL